MQTLMDKSLNSKELAKRLASTFDQSVLRESTTLDVLREVAESAKKYNFRSIVVHPANIETVKELLGENSGTLAVSVCDFPHGKGLTKSRVRDVKEILKSGADEVDIVANYQRLIEDDIRNFKKDLKAVSKAMDGKVLKVILEIDYLNEKLLKEAVTVIKKIANEDTSAKLIVKTKTGFAESKFPNIQAVKIIKEVLGEQYANNLSELGNGKIGIKASGGVRTEDDAINLLNSGAHVLGIGAGKELIEAILARG